MTKIRDVNIKKFETKIGTYRIENIGMPWSVDNNYLYLGVEYLLFLQDHSEATINAERRVDY